MLSTSESASTSWRFVGFFFFLICNTNSFLKKKTLLHLIENVGPQLRGAIIAKIPSNAKASEVVRHFSRLFSSEAFGK